MVNFNQVLKSLDELVNENHARKFNWGSNFGQPN